MTEPIIKPIEAIIAETRKQIHPYVFKRLEARTPRKAGSKIARTITVTSGKGGVGKTSMVANLAICLAQAGQRVIILDADLGLANIDVIFGIRPKHNLMDVINGNMTLDEIMIQGPNGIQIIAGGSGVSELAQLETEQAHKLFDQLKFLEDKTDYLLIDTGAGISDSVISFCQAADQIIVITTTEPTSLADAYGIIKIISNKRPDSHVSVLVNRVDSPEEGNEIHARLSRVASEFLDFEIHPLGSIPQDRQMHLAIRQQTPLMLFSPMSPAAAGIRKIVSSTFHEIPEDNPNEGIEGFLGRLTKFFKGGSSQ
ncbi:MAG: flagellar biosynthesis protein FlhG [Clostridiales bacterium]|jgi:flagellar biosynthesis protein FlhG|nr:flagellar biosynthesis protein FlhG [Clostridiales bacterium]MDN5281355.1 flagellar biosynthesis protein FlhG [Candidatus Ozemobacter sp.]